MTPPDPPAPCEPCPCRRTLRVLGRSVKQAGQARRRLLNDAKEGDKAEVAKEVKAEKAGDKVEAVVEAAADSAGIGTPPGTVYYMVSLCLFLCLHLSFTQAHMIFSVCCVPPCVPDGWVSVSDSLLESLHLQGWSLASLFLVLTGSVSVLDSSPVWGLFLL